MLEFIGSEVSIITRLGLSTTGSNFFFCGSYISQRPSETEAWRERSWRIGTGFNGQPFGGKPVTGPDERGVQDYGITVRQDASGFVEHGGVGFMGETRRVDAGLKLAVAVLGGGG